MKETQRVRPLVIVESPFAGNIAQNVEYARAAVRDSVMRGEAPISSHLLFTQAGVLYEYVPEERQMGIEAGLAWGRVATYAAFYIDHGISPGMADALEHYSRMGLQIKVRRIEQYGSQS
jgi:hypothetical protein